MTLEDQLAAQRERAYASRSPEERKLRSDAMQAIADLKIAERALGVGDAVPRIILPDATGRAVDVSDLLASGPLVISFYRGGWCPYCNLELRALQSRLPDITAAGANLIAISPQLPDESLSTTEKNDLTFPVLSDHGNVVSHQFRLVHEITLGGEVAEVPLPATYVVDTGGIIRFAFTDADFTKRANPDEVVSAVLDLVSG